MGNIGVFAALHDAHDIEADAMKHPAAIGKVRLCRFADAALFDGGHGFDRRAASQRPAQLDLHEDERGAVERYEVDFPAPAAEVMFENVITAIG